MCGRAFGTPTIWLLKNLLVRLGSVFTTLLELTLSKIREHGKFRTLRARGNVKLNYTLGESANSKREPRHRLASLGNPERKTLLAFLFWRG